MLNRLLMAVNNNVIVSDPYFNQTTLLLHGDGTNGGQNNTFIDGSTNNFTITRNGNTTQGTFAPFNVINGQWSNYFSGTSFLTFNSITFNGDFCAECWFYRDQNPAQYSVIFGGPALNGNGNFQFSINNSGAITMVLSATGIIVNVGTACALGQWNHLAWVRQGSGSNNCAVFVNGVRQGTGTSTDNASTCDRIGMINGLFNQGYQPIGYISNARIVIGSSVYDPAQSTLTVPTAPLTAITNTKLLTCQSNRFVDNSSNNFAITNNANTAVRPFSPFNPTAPYSASTNGGSGYFDGTGDYLSIASATGINLSSGDFTIEAWVYWTGSNSGATICDKDGVVVASYPSYNVSLNGSGYMRLVVGSGNGTSSIQTLTSNTLLQINQWVHIAGVKNATTLTLYQNGTSVASATQTATITDGGKALLIGYQAGQPTSTYWDGYIADFRIVKGTAVYTAAFTPPTAPLTAITNTSLLCNFTNAAIIDNTGKTVLETVADAQIDTGTKKFGTGSLEFDGTGDWLLAPSLIPDHYLTVNNFTIELWVYLATGDIGSNRGLISKGTASTGWSVSLNTTEKVVFSYTSSTITSSGAITSNAWNHIAVVREGTGSNQTKIYINGTNDGTGTVSTNFNQNNLLYVGANRTGGDPMKGFIDDLRITKGIARYTANFTPPTAAFPNQ